jgi:hypothetical protein
MVTNEFVLETANHQSFLPIRHEPDFRERNSIFPRNFRYDAFSCVPKVALPLTGFNQMQATEFAFPK